MSLAARAIAVVTARHGVDAVLSRAGNVDEGEVDVVQPLRVVPRQYEGRTTEALAGAVADVQRWMIPHAQLGVFQSVSAGDQITLVGGAFDGRTFTLTKADPGYAGGSIVRWDVEWGGQL